jgi:cardiolipin synthase
LVPVFVALDLERRPQAALAVFVFAASTDILDGLLARMLDQRSKLGAILDPVADKVLGFCALALLVWQQLLPGWLLALVLARDGLMLLGAAVVRRKHLEVPKAPSRIGKYATFGLTCLVVLALVEQWPDAPASVHGYKAVMGLLAAGCVAISTVQYYVRFGYLFFAPAKDPPSSPANPRPLQ